MLIRPRHAFAILTLGGALIACASIAGLDDSDTKQVPSVATTDGGNVTGNGELTTDAGITISPASIEIKGIKCGETKSAPITITNVGTAVAPFSITVPENSAFALEGAVGGTLNGEVPPKEMRTVNLTAKSDAPGNVSADVVVQAGDTTQQITATLETLGAGLVFTPTTVEFGEVRKNTDSPPATIVFQNTGNDPITISGFSAAAGFTLPTNIEVPGGGQVAGTFIMAAGPKDPAPITTTVTPNLDGGALCGAIPTITLKGQRTDQDVTVNPPTLDFGRVGCGAISATKPKLTITNGSPNQVHYVVALSGGSKFKAETALEGDIVKAKDAEHPTVLDLTFSQLTAQASLADIDETLTVDITGAPAPIPQKTIKLHASVYGAVLQVTTGGYYNYADLTNISDNSTGYGAIKNVGNATVCVKYSVSGGSSNYFAVEADDRLDVNYLNDLRVGFDSNTDGNFSTNIVITHADCTQSLGGGESAPFCVAPPTVKASGHRQTSQCCGHYPCPC